MRNDRRFRPATATTAPTTATALAPTATAPGLRRRRQRLPLLVLALAAASTALAATGCSAQDRICGSGQYPVKAVGSTTGRACVPGDEGPPKGYVRYPKGKVPQHVGDKWDTYWGKVVVDGDGRVVKR
jgi:hypothetical protein